LSAEELGQIRAHLESASADWRELATTELWVTRFTIQ
jgi:hypothetical protein